MESKNDIEVLIGGSKYTLCGYESSDYLQRVASYINARHDEINKNFENRMMDNGAKNVLIQLNIADEYFKAQQQIAELNREKEETDRTLFDLKHDLVAAQDKIDKLNEKNKDIAFKLDAEKKKQLETAEQLEEEKRKLLETEAQLEAEKLKCSELEDNISSILNS